MMTDDAFEASPCRLPSAWKHLLLGFSFFHATVQVTYAQLRPFSCQSTSCRLEAPILLLTFSKATAHINTQTVEEVSGNILPLHWWQLDTLGEMR